MGLFVSKLLSNDMHTLERMMAELARAIREGQYEALIRNDSFWSIVSSVASNPSTLNELRGYVSALLEEDWRTSSMLLDMLSPGMSATQRRFVVSIVKLETIARALRSEVFWRLVLDREFVTAIYKYANGRKITDVEWKRMNAPKMVDPQPPESSASPSTPPLARFFTIATLPAVLELLQDISRAPPSLPLPSQTAASISSLSLPLHPPTDPKTNFLLLLHRDLLKLDHIFDRERLGVAPVPGTHSEYTGLGFERKTYIVVRAAIRFMIGRRHTNGNTNTPLNTTPTISPFFTFLLQPAFQSRFITIDFLSRVFPSKLDHFMRVWPQYMSVEAPVASTGDAFASDHSKNNMDLRLCGSLRAYGEFFLRFFHDEDVRVFFQLCQGFDELFLESAFESLYVDLILPLMKPTKFIEDTLSIPNVMPVKSASKNGNGNGNGKSADSSSSSSSSSSSASSKKKPLRSTPVPTLPPLDPSSIVTPSPPFSVPSWLLISIGIIYHWLFEPVPVEILRQSKEHVDRVRGGPKLVTGKIDRLRDMLMSIETYQAWSRIAAAAPISLSQEERMHSHSATPHFSALVHQLVFQSASLRILDYLQYYSPHLAYCMSKAIDELNQLWRDAESVNGGSSGLAIEGGIPMGTLTSMVDVVKTSTATPANPSAPLKPVVDMFAPQLSFHDGTSATTGALKPNLPLPASSTLTTVPATTKKSTRPTFTETITVITPPLPPQLTSPRSRFTVYITHQLRVWCSRIQEGRGFLAWLQSRSAQGDSQHSLPSSRFVYTTQHQTSGQLFHPLPPLATIPKSNESEVFYVELLFFDGVFIEKLLCFAYTYEFAERVDMMQRRKSQQQNQSASPSSTFLASSPSSTVFYSPLYPLVLRNMSQPKSTPIDLGPIRTREYLALICRELTALLQEEHIANFLNRSENFWRFMIDTRWWDIVRDATRNAHPTNGHRSTLHSLLTLVSNKSSSYYNVLLELGHYQQFHEIFSDTNISHVLSLMRLVCSWNVHDIMNQYEETNASTATSSLSTTSASATQADLYSTLTAPFTIWGIVHSLSVVTPLRTQYKGAVHWFLSKRNMQMQTEIWYFVRDILYGEEPQSSEEDANIAATSPDLNSVPAPAPLHTAPPSISSPDASSNFGNFGNSTSAYSRQKLRLRRLHSLAQICKSVHGSGIVQAVFTFPLATAHFYSVVVAEYVWPTRRMYQGNIQTPAADKEAKKASTAADHDPSTTKLVVSQLLSLMSTMALTSETHSFMHIPTVRSAFLEWVNVALEEIVSYGSGAALAHAARVKAENNRKLMEKEREQKERLARIEAEKRVAAGVEIEARKVNEKKRDSKSDKKRDAKARKSRSNSAKKDTTAKPTSPTEPLDMFSASTSYRMLSPDGGALASTSSSSSLLVAASLSPELIPPRRKLKRGVKEDQEVQAVDETNASTATDPSTSPTSSSSSSSSDESISLPPPFAFQSEPRRGEAELEEDKPITPSPSLAAATAIIDARSTLQVEQAPELNEVNKSATTSSPSSTNSLPVAPSLPQRHRLLYSFFQLLLAQPIFKLILTSPSFFEMLSDVSFLEIVASLIFGTIKDGGSSGASSHGSSSSSSSSAHGNTFQQAKDTLVHTSHVIAEKRAQLKLLQKLFAHYRFKLFMAELKSKQFEVHLSECMTNVLNFLNSTNGRALIVAIMNGLDEREKAHQSNTTSPATPTMSVSSRFRLLTDLLSSRSTVRLLTSPRFWLLFADPVTLDYFSNGQYLRLWLHQQSTMKSIKQPVWELVKQSAEKYAARRLHLQQPAQQNGAATLDTSTTKTSLLKRGALKEYVKKKLHSSAGHSSTPHAAAAASVAPEESHPPIPSGIAAIQHAFTLVQSIYALITGQQPISSTPIRANL